MITHNQLIHVLTTEWPQLVHGVDFWVGHGIDGNNQTSDAFVVAWPSKQVQEPTPVEIQDLINKHQVSLEAYIAEQDLREAQTKVNLERDRRTEDGFYFDGTKYDFDMRSKTNISGAAQLAFIAISAGVQPGDLLWHGGVDAFSWIAQDNSEVTMDAPTVIAFGQAAAAHEKAHIFAARNLKNMYPIPLDYTDNSYWPDVTN